MDLTGWLLRRADPRPFVVTGVGGTGARIAVERASRERGWSLAAAPAAADVLVVCRPGGADLPDPVERVWRQLPSPRARAWVAAPEQAGPALDAARDRLLDVAGQRRAAADRVRAADPATGGGADAMAGHGGDHHDHGGAHGDGAMLPGGLPMAERAEDRDGLTLDRLHVAFGPALPDWPPGLVVRLAVQGDVVQRAEVALEGTDPATAAGPGGAAFWDTPVRDAEGRPDAARTRAAVALDALQRLLAIAGWSGAALSGQRLRDALLTPDPEQRRDTRAAISRWLRRVRRSRLLRWSTDGLGGVDGAAPPGLRGDATTRWNRWLDHVEAALTTPTPATLAPTRPIGAERAEETAAAVELLPSLLTGRELAAARLIVASLDPDPELLATHNGDRA